ncbi:hypothetical protein TrRE_jg413 [Triparma retinervis]|uniref:Fe2OG dioxygenase domain-containing protein n=1 Tax=Triparma retinervis TaxID=2557542 RepID=A0A9W6ZZW6_9STRA|nr:hypothetical protein TrRE_jg413 [Triparma retinervis]
MVLPPHIDLKSPNAKSDIIASITHTLNPMFLVTVPSLSNKLHPLINDIKENQKSRIESGERLGPHCDGNFVTLLWATSSGLQVPRDNGCISSTQVKSIGLPSLSAAEEGQGREMTDSDWDTVQTTSPDDVIVTIGNEWIRRDLHPDINKDVWCPVLHRVKNGGGERWSVPFLCALESDEGAAG